MNLVLKEAQSHVCPTAWCRPMHGKQSLPAVGLHPQLAHTTLACGIGPTAECGFLVVQAMASNTMIYTIMTCRRSFLVDDWDWNVEML